MNKRENIFSKLNLNNKNLNLELEKILDEKKFTENAQSLILSMFYKIENAYKDYYKVKRQMPTKEIFVQTIIDIIKKYCNEIEIIKPKGKKNEKKYEIDIKKGKIKCFANEDILLMGLLELKNVNLKKEDLLEDALSEILKYGNSLNYQEVIRAFNGWSWQDTLSQTYDLYCNLIYQNLLIIIGNEKLQEIIESKRKISKIEEELEKYYSQDFVKKIIEFLLRIAISIKINHNKEYKLNVESYFCLLNDEFKKLENKEELINFIASKRKEITKKIADIDIKLNDINYLRKEFYQMNKKTENNGKIFSISDLTDMYEDTRAELLNSMKEYNKLVDPKQYINKKEELKNKIDLYIKLDVKLEKKINIEKIIIDFQSLFLECFQIKINQCKEKKEIVNLIYCFRYYELLNYCKEYKIKDSAKLKKQLQEVLNDLTNKAEELKAMEKFSSEGNAAIIKNIFTSEIITLDNIIIQFFDSNEDEKKYKVQYYDGVMLVKEMEIKLKDVIYKKKKLRLFI